MSIILWNVEGLVALQRHSPDCNPFDNAAIIIVTETLLSDETYCLPGYYPFIQPAPTPVTFGNGIAIFARPELQPKLLSKSTCHVAIRTKDFDVVGFYLPPAIPIEDVLLEVGSVVSGLPGNNKGLIVMGDFNCRMDGDDRGPLLEEMMIDQFGLALVSNPSITTFRGPQGSSVIDLIFSNQNPSTDPKVIKTLDRRHCKVISEWECPPTICTTPKPVRSRNLVMEILKNHTHLQHVEPLIKAGATSTAARLLSEAMIDSCPIRHPRKHSHKPWFDGACKEKKEAVLSCGGAQFWDQRRAYKKLCKEKRLEWEEAELQKKLEDTEVKPWELFKERIERPVAPVPFDGWQTHFGKLLDPDKSPPNIQLPASQAEEERSEDWYNQAFSKEEVGNALNHLKDRKAAGPDGIRNEHLKQSVGILLTTWFLLLNTCLRLGTIPEQWRHSTLVALFKGKGSNTEPGNYRGIALLSVVFKLLTKLLNRRIMYHIQDILPPEQYGFRPGLGTREAINKLLIYLKEKILPKKGKAYAAFVDFEKAFDSVDRDLLVRKLREQFNIKGLILRLISTILEYNSIRVFDGLRSSPEIRQHRGVLQGDSLSPTLFLCFVADLADALRDVPGLQILFYADDLVFYASEAQPIKDGFRILEKWCKENKLNVNVNKTKVLKFRKAGRLAKGDKFRFNGKKIEMCNSYDYLGITLQPSLTFTKHLLRRKAKALAAIGSLHPLSRTSIPTALKIFEMKVKPMITYGWDSISRFLSGRQLLEADRVKTIFLKKALAVPKNSSATLSVKLCDTDHLVEDLRKKGIFEFSEEAITVYEDHRNERELAFTEEQYERGPAFHETDWKRSNRKHRHAYTRTTAHGFHHKICSRPADFHKRDGECCCRFCKKSCIERLHVTECGVLGRQGDLASVVEYLDKT